MNSILRGEHLAGILGGGALFLVVSVPSLKVIGPGVLVNGVALAAVLLCATFLPESRSGSMRKKLSFFWLCFYLIIYLTALQTYDKLGFGGAIKHAYVLTLIVGITWSASICSGRWLVYFMLAWAAFLSIWQIWGGVPLNRDAGQHYLTLSVPLGAALSASLTMLLFSRMKLTKRIILVVVSFLIIMALATLRSRSALVFPIISIGATFIFILFFSRDRSLPERLIYLSVVAFCFSLFSYWVYSNFNLMALNRMESISGIGEEPRAYIYADALQYILENPLLGYGVGAVPVYFGNYPHNIFLELFFSGGIVLGVLFFIFVMWYLLIRVREIRSGRHNDPILAGLGGAGLFMFLQWNTSFSLESAYIPLGIMVVHMLSVESSRRGITFPEVTGLGVSVVK